MINPEKYMSLKKFKKIIDILINYYPNAKCSLNYNSPLELTIALILAAQCTDLRVNQTTPLFFQKFPNITSIANADEKSIADIIKSCGFYKNKASNIKKMVNLVIDRYNSAIPNTMEDLIKLNGIGRKSANVILQECFNTISGIAVDTHVTRISRKTGFSNALTQSKIEQDLMKKFDKKYWSKINHVLVYHGREICTARKPKCDKCPVNNICPKND